jgi:hypothetical protein
MITKRVQKMGIEARQKCIKEHREAVQPLVLYYRRIGVGYKQIAIRLNMLGYRTRRQRKHNAQSVMRIFHRI